MEPRHPNPDDKPGSMHESEVVARRHAMLQEAHIAPLTAYADRLEQMGLGRVPYFDPLDGGIEARVLFLFKKPGRMSADGFPKRPGSGFISRNNQDFSAAATFSFMNEAEIPRKETVSWNVIPWWNDTGKTTAKELAQGSEQLPGLLDLLFRLRAVVMVGGKAQKVRRQLARYSHKLELIGSPMPSLQVMKFYPDQWRAIPREWAKARTVFTSPSVNPLSPPS